MVFFENDIVMRATFLIGGLLLGLLTEKAILDRLRKLAAKTEFMWDDLLADALRGMPTVWLTAGGIYLALGVGEPDEFVVSMVKTVLTVALIGSVILSSMRVVGGAVEHFSARSSVRSPTLIVNLARLSVGVLGIFIILQNLDVNITPLITAFGLGGLAVALALQDTLGNLFAGVQIIFSGQVRPQDYVRLSSGEEGYITDVKGRNTTVHTFPDGNLVVVPNSTLANSIVKNYSKPRQALWVSTEVGVSYDSDLEHVEAVTMEVAEAVLADVKGGLSERPIVIFHTFGSSSIDFEVRMMVKDFVSRGRVRHEFIKRLHKRFGEEGIEIPFPIRTVVMQGPTATAPSSTEEPE